MSPFPADEVSPELCPSPPLFFRQVIKSYVRSRNLSQERLGDKSRDHTDVQSLNLIASHFFLLPHDGLPFNVSFLPFIRYVFLFVYQLLVSFI